MIRSIPSEVHPICVMSVISVPGEWGLPIPHTPEERVRLDYREVLRCLAINDESFGEKCVTGVDSVVLDPKTLALVRLGALVAVGAAVPSYGAAANAAMSSGATAAEIVDVLVAVVSLVGLPSMVAAAPRLALALGHDIDDALEQGTAGDLGSSPRRPIAVARRTAAPRDDAPSFR